MPIPSSDGEEDLLLRDGGSIVHSLVLRSLTHDDVPAIKALCAASFPIQYPECWYAVVLSAISSSILAIDRRFEEVVSGALISVGLFDDEQLVAMMVAETKTILHCNPEVAERDVVVLQDRDIVADTGAHVVYMLSLAVAHPYRRLGLASRLLRHLLDSVCPFDHSSYNEIGCILCLQVVDNPPYPKAVFLHVLSTNTAAIKFYKSNGFVHHTTLL
ncbi:acetyltransferase, GNAT family [Ancylostoma ceylanicum]|uniref:N-alpha-acetyltransferase 60 n=1 Tax=Ancylostoma ceylanicum TaxID=53326 RepID=A0A0D6L5S0_9BILA|nr:acetyltransferase, GNAT family [Ancylostoma ceylanicum]